jgi:hypothetical protein
VASSPLKLWIIGGMVVRRRPSKANAEMDAPCGFPQSGSMEGHGAERIESPATHARHDARAARDMGAIRSPAALYDREVVAMVAPGRGA